MYAWVCLPVCALSVEQQLPLQGITAYSTSAIGEAGAVSVLLVDVIGAVRWYMK